VNNSSQGEIVAALDLGTNTFHILIATLLNGQIVEIHKERIWVNLAEEGINRIGDKALMRCTSALEKFRNLMNEYKVQRYYATGTAALRTSENGQAFIQRVKRDLGFEINLISGIREAELIYKGTEMVVPGTRVPNLIMDIGGGSTEFIKYDHAGKLWSRSYKAGVTHIFNVCQPVDPLNPESIQRINNFLRQELL